MNTTYKSQHLNKLLSLLQAGDLLSIEVYFRRTQRSLYNLCLSGDRDSLNIIEQHINLSSICKSNIEEYKDVIDSVFVDELFENFDDIHLKSNSNKDNILFRKWLEDTLYLALFASYGIFTFGKTDTLVTRAIGLVDTYTNLFHVPSLPQLNTYLHRNYDDPVFDDYLNKFRYVYKNTRINTDLGILQHHLMVRYLRGSWDKMLKYTNNSSTFVKGRANTVDIVLYDIKKFLDSEIRDVPVKIQEIVSKPGLGKTTYIQSFATILSALVPFLKPKELVYTRVSDFFWNGYQGQPIVLYDDVSHNKSRKVDVVGELIAIGSGVFTSPPMAFEKDTKFVSMFCFITSNIPIITTINNQETVLALKRRMVSDQVTSYCNAAMLDSEGIYRYRMKGRFLHSIVSKTSFEKYMLMYVNTLTDLAQLELTFDEDFDLEESSPVQLEDIEHTLASSVGGFCPKLIVQGVDSSESVNCFGPSNEAHLNNKRVVNSDDLHHSVSSVQDLEGVVHVYTAPGTSR